MTDIQTRKLQFMEQFIRLTDESIIDKLTQLLREEKQKTLQAKFKSITHEELAQKLERSEYDIKEGRLHTQEEVEIYFKNKQSK